MEKGVERNQGDRLHSVHTMVDEGRKFAEEHSELNETQAAWGAVVWGLLRALYECPNCPGYFRVPRMTTVGVEVLWCARCGGQWVHKDDLAALEPKQLGLGEEA